MVSKVTIRVFTYLGALFLMSHIIVNNVAAFDFTTDFNSYEYVFGTSRYNMNCTINGVSTTNQGVCSFTEQGENKATELRSYQTLDVESGDIVKFTLVVVSSSNFDYRYNVQFVNNQISNGRLLGFKEILQDDVSWNTSMYYIDEFNYYMDGGSFISRAYEYYVYFPNDITGYHLGLLSTNSSYPIFYSYVSSDTVGVVSFKIVDISQWRYVGSPESKMEEEKTQEAADASADAGDSSSSDAEQGTASLISAIGSAVSVISSASPTNCKINGNMGNLDVGQIDLCANPVPTFIQAIGSLILILITVPLCITLFNRFIALFRSFQG